MGTLVMVLVVIACVLLMLVILVQNPKGGLASNFSSANQIGGVRRTADFLEKATWTLGIALVVLSIVSASLINAGAEEVVDDNTTELMDEANNQAFSPPVNAQPMPTGGGGGVPPGGAGAPPAGGGAPPAGGGTPPGN